MYLPEVTYVMKGRKELGGLMPARMPVKAAWNAVKVGSVWQSRAAITCPRCLGGIERHQLGGRWP